MRGRGLTLALALALTACALLALPGLAAAAVTGAIEGTVTEAGSASAIAGDEVCAVRVDGEGFGCAATDASGKYAIEGLAAGKYIVEFTGSVCPLGGGECHHPFIRQFYEDATSTATAKLVTVVEGGTAAGIDASLEKGGTIAGTVVKAAGGAPIAGATVCAESESKRTFQCATTAANGEYAIEGLLSASDYIVEFFDLECSGGGCRKPYVFEYYNEATSFAAATPVAVSAPGATAGIDARLAQGGVIGGTVTSASIYKTPIAGMFLCARSAEAFECAVTNAGGEYTIEGLPSGAYMVEFSGEVCAFKGGAFECGAPYLRQFYSGKAAEGEANLVNVTAPLAVSGIDASMLESAPQQPGVLSAPVLTGSAVPGATLSCSQGLWSNNPTSLTYEWLLDGIPIAGQSGAIYVVQSGDQGHTLTCQVTVRNAAGSAIASSNALTVPAAAPPPAKPVLAGKAIAPGSATAKGGTVLVRLSCTGGGACKGVIRLIAKLRARSAKAGGHKPGSVLIGEASFSIAAGAHATVRVHLTTKGRRLLAKAGRRGLKVRVSGSGVKARALLIKPARGAHRKGGH